ncbi:MAG: integrase, partial [Lachnospiraceae bacterium]|nr:integrase [Lachnospiraceae bacterium]
MGTTIPIRNQNDIETIKKYFLEKDQYRNYALFVVGINTALRISDLLNLDWRDVYNFDSHTWRKYV